MDIAYFENTKLFIAVIKVETEGINLTDATINTLKVGTKFKKSPEKKDKEIIKKTIVTSKMYLGRTLTICAFDCFWRTYRPQSLCYSVKKIKFLKYLKFFETIEVFIDTLKHFSRTLSC